MADPFLAEIRIFPFNFAPYGWATCNGQLLSISQNTALFSLLGTFYGGDGRTTFALPNLLSSAPMHFGNGPGLTPRRLGETGGTPTVTLRDAEVATHSHTWKASIESANARIPDSTRTFASATANAYQTAAPDVSLNAQAVAKVGNGGPHNNLMPYLVLNICICLQGVWPPRS